MHPQQVLIRLLWMTPWDHHNTGDPSESHYFIPCISFLSQLPLLRVSLPGVFIEWQKLFPQSPPPTGSSRGTSGHVFIGDIGPGTLEFTSGSGQVFLQLHCFVLILNQKHIMHNCTRIILKLGGHFFSSRKSWERTAFLTRPVLKGFV